MTDDATASEILSLTQQLLDSIEAQDWETYARLCADDLTAFESEAGTHLVEGMPFHKHYFDIAKSADVVSRSSISSPKIDVFGDVALICYTRLQQTYSPSAGHGTNLVAETRLWRKVEGTWEHIHFHRSH